MHLFVQCGSHIYSLVPFLSVHVKTKLPPYPSNRSPFSSLFTRHIWGTQQLLRGASPKVKDSFGLTGGASDYSLTNCGNCTAVDGMDDSKEFNDTLAAMKVGTRVCVWLCLH
jgi:hypothetical protein